MSELVERMAATLRQTADLLRAASVPPEALAEYVPEHRKMLVRRRATMRPVAEVWRLGTLLLGAAEQDPPALFFAGRATRAAVRPYPGNQSISREERRDIAAAALQGGYPEGATVNFNATAVALDAASIEGLPPTAPLGFHDGQVRVRWRAGAPLDGAPTLAQYLGERAELLVSPPQGAG